jgi:hypothetical protein
MIVLVVGRARRYRWRESKEEEGEPEEGREIVFARLASLTRFDIAAMAWLLPIIQFRTLVASPQPVP